MSAEIIQALRASTNQHEIPFLPEHQLEDNFPTSQMTPIKVSGPAFVLLAKTWKSYGPERCVKEIALLTGQAALYAPFYLGGQDSYWWNHLVSSTGHERQRIILRTLSDGMYHLVVKGECSCMTWGGYFNSLEEAMVTAPVKYTESLTMSHTSQCSYGPDQKEKE